jgi:hypothetical protein
MRGLRGFVTLTALAFLYVGVSAAPVQRPSAPAAPATDRLDALKRQAAAEIDSMSTFTSRPTTCCSVTQSSAFRSSRRPNTS